MNKIKPAFQIKLPLLAVAAGLLLSQTLAPAATFNVTPSAVSNTYTGTITLQIGGLTNGETVTVQKYLNLSGQGVITANDWLVEQFNLTDGQAGMVIGGVTNFNVPGDTDTFGGQITSVLNFQNGDFIQDIVGKYLYRLSSPVGHFPPVTNALLVTNYPFAQKFSGTVTSNGTSTVVPNAVVLLSGSGGGPMTGTVANSSGGYTIAAPTGTYSPIAVGLGYVFEANDTTTSYPLAAGKTVTANLTITNSNSHITGTVVDANNASLGLPGVLVTAQESSGGPTSASFTDPNGNFSLGVLSGSAQWNVQPNNTAFLVDGYMSVENGVNANAGATGVTLSVPKANALFYGTVLDNSGKPIQGVEVDTQDNNALYQGRAFTDANGNYFAVALGGLNNDAWELQINTSSSSYIFAQPLFDQTGGTNLAAGQALQANLTALAANNTISGTLKDGNGAPLAGIDIYANTTTGTSYNQNAQTDVNGNYSLNVVNGTWQVGVSSCTGCGSGSLPATYLNPQTQTVVIANNSPTVNFVAVIAPYTISGTLKDNNGNPLAGVGVYAYTITGTSYNQNALTDANGNYSVSVVNGSWQIAVQTCTDCGSQSLPANYLAPSFQTELIANASVTANFIATLAPYTISGSLKDGNGNPLAGIGVYEYATINNVNYNQNATTDANGNYSMAALNGTWTVGVNSGGGNNSLPNNYAQVQNQTVVVANANATANFVAQACGGVSITPALPDGQASVFYDQFLQASSCNNNFIWVFVSGNLPPGLTMNIFGSGEISGTTTNTGTYYFTVQVTDGINLTATQPISLTIDSGSGTGQTGSLNVTVNPQNIGAQWQVDGGALQSSGATVAGLSVGNHTVSFSTVSGYTTPANQTVAITANTTATATGTYAIIQTGSLEVTINPASTGAQWQVDGSNLHNSGVTVAGLSVGNHTVTFSTVTGYTTPANQAVTITANTTAGVTGTYVLAGPTGSLEVTIAPAGAITAGAQWQVDGGALQNSGTTVPNLSVGSHTVSFSAINGWTAPVNQKVAIQSKVVSKATGTYVVIPTGSLQVTLVPPGAVAGSAQWQVDSGAFQNSGATVANLSVGNHTVNFKGINYWTAPVHQTVAIKAKIVTKATGTYAFDAQGIYNGLFAQPDTNVTTSGMLSGLAVTSSGAFSAKLLIAGSTNAVAGSFNAGGLANANVPRPAKQGGPLTLTMQVNWNAVPLTIGGTVSGVNGGAWTAGLTAELAATGLPSVAYTASLLPPGTPPGYGYFTITNHAGAVTLIGALADGTPISEAVPVSGLGDLPVYGNLYGSTGLLLGWLNLESGSPAGQLTWLKEASHSTVRYTNGFTNLLTVQGSRWTNPAPKMAAINLPAGFLDLAGGNLPAPLTFNVGVNNNNALVKLAAVPANLLTGSINPKTGLFTLNFNIGTGKATNVGTGVVLQNVTNAAGFFLGTNNAGSFILHP